MFFFCIAAGLAEDTPRRVLFSDQMKRGKYERFVSIADAGLESHII
jgi:hypothetical protein